MLYPNRPLCILNFEIRVQNMLVGSSFIDISVRPRLLLNLTPWNFKGISYINPFKNFDKSNTTANIYYSLFGFHRSHYHNYIVIYSDGSKTNNVMWYCLQKQCPKLPTPGFLFYLLGWIPCCGNCFLMFLCFFNFFF